MTIALLVPINRRRAWHDELAAALRSVGEVEVFTSAVAPDPSRFEVMIDLAGNQPPSSNLLSLRFDGEPGEDRLIARVLKREPPLIEVVDGAGRVLAGSYAALETPLQLNRSLESLGRRCVALLVAAVRRLTTGALPDPGSLPTVARSPARHTGAETIRAGAARFASAADQRLNRRRRWPALWTVALRRSASDGPPSLDGDEWRRQTHAGFLADPCLHDRAGRVSLFAEALEFGARRGRIVRADVTSAGDIGELCPVLAAEHHLSYPFVFDHDGEVFLVPETGATGRVELYRASSYPDRWVREATLISGPKLVDSTLVWRSGLWWLFAGGAEHGDSAHDQLFLYFAESLTGPWTAHPIRPLRSDARISRPAGRLLEVDGKLYRPSQDNAARYGGGLNWAEVIELTPGRYREIPVAHWSGADFGRFDGVHTYSRAGGFEAIDLLSLRARYFTAST